LTFCDNLHIASFKTFLSSYAKDLGEIRTESPQQGRQIQVGWVKIIGDFRTLSQYN